MNRREFITLFGGTAVAWPLAARAQQPTMPVVGWLGSGLRQPTAHNVDAFHRGLAENAYVEGQNVALRLK